MIRSIAVVFAYATLSLVSLDAHAQSVETPMPSVTYPSAGTAVSTSSAAPRRAGQAQTTRNRDGQFYFTAGLNSAFVPMMVDTGASMVVLRAEDAVRAGLNPEMLTYSVRSNTANGVAYSARARLRTLTIGGITQTDVPVMVAKAGALHISLLGQSFLSQLASFRVSGDAIVLQSE